MSFTRRLASLRLALFTMAWLGVGGVLSYKTGHSSIPLIVMPFCVLAVNLTAALATNRRFRRQSGLMIFHACLLAVLILVGVGWLTALQARFEITEGQEFSKELLKIESAGPWHPFDRLSKVHFVQGPFEVQYDPGLIRRRTLTNVRQQSKTVRFGDNIPLRLHGYSFYSTSNKGYSVVMTWTGKGGASATGAINMPSYPVYDWKQEKSWTTPGGNTINLKLALPDAVSLNRQWVLDSRQAGGVLVLEQNGRVEELKQGESVSFPGGSLRFEAIRMWIGYTVFFDPTLPWLFALSVVGVGGLGWHFWAKFSPKSVPARIVAHGNETVGVKGRAIRA